MKIIKRGQVFELEKIQKYPRYGLYQVYKIIGEERVPIYKECYTGLQLRELADKKYIINDEEVFE